jgi:aminoglycoside phosphotransferase (APT) family kinase protein
MMKEKWRVVIQSIDDTEIASAIPLRRRNQTDLLVTCASSSKHLIRYESQHVSVLRQKWAYEQLLDHGLPCPKIEAYVPPSSDFPEGCLVLSWLDAVPAGDIIGREGPGFMSFGVCRDMGRLLRDLHAVRVVGVVPDYVFTSTRQGTRNFAVQCMRSLEVESLVDAEFSVRFLDLVAPYIERIPDPAPQKLYFSDMHFGNVLFYDEDPPRIAGFVDVEELGVGWPLGDFTNWECWGIRFFGGWARQHILQGYGAVDMDMYRMAVMVRLARPITFSGSIRYQIGRAVAAQDINAFDLDALY